ncbi:hypothetical protein KKF84_04120 [Myxococcota bacterium]|nr:hypothetical protein [Myxococcota bacterium]MBU1534481.1 hypothetical protein [Myxococcota bacterium]
MTTIAGELTWIRHRVIIPLQKPALFAHLLKKRFPRGATTCPMDEKLSENPDLVKKLLAPLASKNGVTLSRKRIETLIDGWIACIKGKGPKAAKLHGQVVEAINPCGPFCTSDCLNRLSLECIISDLSKSPTVLLSNLERWIIKAFPKLAPIMGTVCATLTDDMITVEVKVK